MRQNKKKNVTKCILRSFSFDVNNKTIYNIDIGNNHKKKKKTNKIYNYSILRIPAINYDNLWYFTV